MSERELRRGEVLSRVKRGELKLVEGAERGNDEQAQHLGQVVLTIFGQLTA